MFCSNCGNQLNIGLNYCNRCGTPISANELKTDKSVTESLSETISYIGGGGLIGFIFIVLVLVKKEVPQQTLIAISFFYLATLFGICFLIIQHIKNLSKNFSAERKEADDYLPPNRLSAKKTAQLEEHLEPSISVTEQTTRNFDKVPLKEN